MSRILIVDDDADVRAVAKAILTTAGHNIALAENGYEALTLLDKNEYDLIISDANMPNISGYELVRRVRTNNKNRHIPIALLTARREREDIERALQLGVNDYIVKPLDPLVFVRKIESLLTKTPFVHDNEVMLTEGEAPSEITLNIKAQIMTLSDQGLTIQTNYPLVIGEKIALSTPFFRMTLGIQPPSMKVESVQESQKTGVWSARLVFVGTGESTLQKIRSWMNQRQAKTGKKVA